MKKRKGNTRDNREGKKIAKQKSEEKRKHF